MAFLDRRWPWILGLAGAALVAAYLPPRALRDRPLFRDDWSSYPTPESRRAKRLGDDYFQAAERASLVELRDSLMRDVARRSVRQGTIVALSPASRVLDSVARVIVRASIPPVPSLSPDVRTAFAFVGAHDYWAGAGDMLFTPVGTDGHTCIAAHKVRLVEKQRVPAFLRPSESLGPCSLYMAFGLPGPGIAAWLEAHQYSFALEPDWTLPQHTPVPIEDADTPLWLRVIIARVKGTGDEEFFSYGPYWESFGLVGCAVGNRAGCHQYIFGSPESVDPRAPLGVVRPYVYQLPPTARLLSSLVRDQGVDRFRRFWQSPLPPEQAFAQSFNVPFDQWAREYARSIVGPVRVSTVAELRDVLASLVWVGLCVGVCVLLAAVRRVA